MTKSADTIERQSLALQNVTNFAEYARGKLPPNVAEDIAIVVELARQALRAQSNAGSGEGEHKSLPGGLS